jgi:hypothetical protein
VGNSTTFANLNAEYEAEWANCQIRDDKRGTVAGVYVATLNANEAKYQQVAAQFQGMPWYFIGVIHAMETGFREKTEGRAGSAAPAAPDRFRPGSNSGAPGAGATKTSEGEAAKGDGARKAPAGSASDQKTAGVSPAGSPSRTGPP